MTKHEDHMDFVNPGLDFKLVHYVEKRAHHGDTLDNIRKDLLRGGRKKEEIQKYIDYVETHKSKINLHNIWWQLAFFGIGLFILLLIGAAVYYFAK